MTKTTQQNERLQRALLQVIEQQLIDGKPAETRATKQRLLDAGYTEDQAMNLIAHVVAAEIFDVMARGRKYEEARYIAALQALPALPWDKDNVD